MHWCAAFAIQLWLAAGFAGMSVVSIYADSPSYTAVWPYLFALVSLLSLLTVVMPTSARVAAAAGAVLVMVGVARVVAVVQFYDHPIWSDPWAALHVLLWGLHVVVGMRWPSLAYESGVRHLLDIAKDRPKEPASPVKES